MKEDKEIRVGPDELFGRGGLAGMLGGDGGEDVGKMMRLMVLSMEKKRIQESDTPLNALSGTQTKAEFDDLRKIVTLTIDIPFKANPEWDRIKKTAQRYTGEPVLLIA